MNISRVIVFLFSFIVFFVLFYFEGIDFLGVKFAVLWKTLLMFLLLLYSLVIVVGRGFQIHGISFWGLMFSFQSFFNASTFSSPITSLSDSVKNSYLPIIFLSSRSGNKNLSSYDIIIWLSLFTAISTLPFILGFIQPLSAGYDLSLFGVDGFGFVGIFQNSHAASITLGTALIVLIYDLHLGRSGFGRFFTLLLILISLFALYKTFARTGYFLFFVGLMTYFVASERIKYKLIKLSFFSLFIFVALFFLYHASEVFRMRLVGENIYTAASGSVDVDSGRSRFIFAAIQYFLDQDIPTMIVGLGSEYGKDLMYQHVGMRIYSHNGFVDIFQFHGLLGLVLYLFFLYCVSVRVYSVRYSAYFPLIFSLYMSYVAQMLVQGERIFLADVIFALSLSVPDTSRNE